MLTKELNFESFVGKDHAITSTFGGFLRVGQALIFESCFNFWYFIPKEELSIACTYGKPPSILLYPEPTARSDLQRAGWLGQSGPSISTINETGIST